MATRKIEIVELAKITPDANQPRKSFDAARLADLIGSIREHGIINPIVVEKWSGGGYLLVDGERRYRAAKELKLKEVPVIIEEPMKPLDRLIQQFHLQEQHQGWSAVEKAIAVHRLAEEMAMTPTQVAKLLSLPPTTIGQYIAFASLIHRKDFEKNEVPLIYSNAIVSTRNAIKNHYKKHNEEFSKEDEANIELSIIKRIKSGEITRRSEISKLRDIAFANVKEFRKFLTSEKKSLDELFTETSAKRNALMRDITYKVSFFGTQVGNAIAMDLGPSFEGAGKSRIKKLHADIGLLIRTFKD